MVAILVGLLLALVMSSSNDVAGEKIKFYWKKWHTIRVSITPSENGDGTSKVNGILDGVLRYTGNLAIDLSELQYGLGIAYDAMHQDAYGRKFFTGKIGYIRYGKIK